MSNLRLKGLAWGHRRATGPLAPLNAAFQQERPDVTVEWTVRPLSDFEHQPIADIAGRYDLLIIDHPFCGDIAASRALLAFESALPDVLGRDADSLYVGPSLASYRYGGHVWAAPIDAATPHAAYRADLLERAGEAVPTNWAETIALGTRLRKKGLWLGTPILSPHAFATVACLMANIGRPIDTDPSVPFTFDADAMDTALAALEDLVALSAPESLNWNAIDIEGAMVARDDIAFTPSVYGYATYAEKDMRVPLRFSDFCGLVQPYANGSMLGGTGLAISASSLHPDAALAFVHFCMSRQAQDRIIPEHHGQPARVTAWNDAANDQRFGGYFGSVRKSMEGAWIRPRGPGYIRFQAEAGRVVQAYCRREIDRKTVIESLAQAGREVFRAARSGATRQNA